MKRVLYATAVAALTSLAGAPTAWARSEEPPAAESPPRVAILVDTSALPENQITKLVSQWLSDGAQRALTEAGVEVAAQESTVVLITVRRYGEQDVHYEVTTGIREGEAEDLIAARTFSCEMCTDEQLEAKVTQDVARLSGWLLHDAEPSDDPEIALPPSSPPAPVADQEVEDDRRIGGMGIAGATLISAGGVAIIAGAVVVSRGVTDSSQVDNATRRHRDFRAPGKWTLAAGAVSLGVGLPLLIADVVARHKRRRGRKDSRARNVQLTPTWTRGPALSLEGKF